MPKETNAGKAGGKVLSFKQTGDFFLRRGLSKHDRNNVLDAVTNYRQALELEPDNAEYTLALARAYTEMNCFDDSNLLVLSLFRGGEAASHECYFALGCNFLGLQDYKRARESLERYAELEPEGEFIEETADMLEVLEDDFAFRETFPLADEDIKEATAASEKGKHLLEEKKFDEAVSVLSDAVDRYPDLAFLRSNLALAAFCAKDYERAGKEIQTVLKKNPSDIQAHCNLALFSNTSRDRTAVEREIEFLTSAKTDDIDDDNRIAITLLELGRVEEALPVARRVYSAIPYDPEVMHRYGMCLYSENRFREAAELYDRILKIYPEDSVARFYRGVCRAAEAGGKKRKNLPFTYQVPYSEVVSRLQKMNECTKMPYEKMKAEWMSNVELRSLLIWSLALAEPPIRHAMLSLISSFGDRRAELLLRKFALSRTEPDEFKEEIFGLLKRMDATEPYFGYIGGDLVIGHVSEVDDAENIPAAYRDVLENALTKMQTRCGENALFAAVTVWETYLAGLSRFPNLSEIRMQSFSAALEYVSRTEAGESVTKAEISADYGISRVRLNTAVEKLRKAIEAAEKEAESEGKPESKSETKPENAGETNPGEES